MLVLPFTGVYDETVFKALDYIIYRAKHYGVRLILTLGDQWNTADSKINYLEWGNATTNTNLFFTSPVIQGYYQQHIHTMLNRNVSYWFVHARRFLRSMCSLRCLQWLKYCNFGESIMHDLAHSFQVCCVLIASLLALLTAPSNVCVC